MATLLEIEIKNWEKFNPKRDQKTYTWLRLSNDIAYDPKLYGLDAEQKFCWIEILCQASKANCGQVSINIDQLAHITGVKRQKIDSLIDFLVATAVIEARDRALPQLSSSTTPTYERTNDTNVRNTIAQPVGRARDSFDFDAVYEKYPRKVGKKNGIKSCFTQIKSIEDYRSLIFAVEKYRDLVLTEKTESKFIKHFDTFMNCWRDYLDPDVGSSHVPNKADIYALIRPTEVRDVTP